MQSTNPPKCPYCHVKSKLIQGDLYDDRYGAPGRHSVYQCPKCGYGQTLPGIKKSAIGEFYRRYYPLSKVDAKKLAMHPLPPHPLIRWLLGLGHTCHWQTRPGMRVLDIGSGSGRSLIEIEALGGHAYGIEPDPTAEKIAKKLQLNVHQCFITDRPFPGMKFDLITASQVIEHEPDPLKFLLAAKAKLKPKGTIVFSTPNLDSFGRKVYGGRWINWHIPYHLSFYTKKTIVKLAKLTGLKVVKIATVTPTLWSVLQWQMLTHNQKMGKSSSLWTNGNNPKRFDYLNKVLLYLMAFPYSRTVDFLGKGESLVVRLTK